MSKIFLLLLVVSVGLNYVASGIHRLPVMTASSGSNPLLFLLVGGVATAVGSLFITVFIAFIIELGRPYGGPPGMDWYPFLTFYLLQLGMLWVTILEANRTKEMQWKKFCLIIGVCMVLLYPMVMTLKPYTMLSVVIFVWLVQIMLYRKEVTRQLLEDYT